LDIINILKNSFLFFRSLSRWSETYSVLNYTIILTDGHISFIYVLLHLHPSTELWLCKATACLLKTSITSHSTKTELNLSLLCLTIELTGVFMLITFDITSMGEKMTIPAARWTIVTLVCRNFRVKML